MKFLLASILVFFSASAFADPPLVGPCYQGKVCEANVTQSTVTTPGPWTATLEIRLGDPSKIGTRNFAPTLAYVGDSLTSGVGGTHPYNFYITLPQWNGQNIAATNIGVGGATCQSISDTAWQNWQALFEFGAAFNASLLWCGTNDIAVGGTVAAAYSILVQLSQHQRLLGWKIMVGTMISRNGLDTQKNQLNALIRGNWSSFADVLVDFAANANIGADGAYANPTYFQPDGVHLTDAGYMIVGGIANTSINNYVSTPINTVQNLPFEYRTAMNGTAGTVLTWGWQTSAGAFSEQMRLNRDDGRLGIGTQAPNAVLTVANGAPPSTMDGPGILSMWTPSDGYIASWARGNTANPQELLFGLNQASLYSEIQASHAGISVDDLWLQRQGGPLRVGGTVFMGSVGTGTPATYACFTAGGQLVSSAAPC